MIPLVPRGVLYAQVQYHIFPAGTQESGWAQASTEQVFLCMSVLDILGSYSTISTPFRCYPTPASIWDGSYIYISNTLYPRPLCAITRGSVAGCTCRMLSPISIYHCACYMLIGSPSLHLPPPLSFSTRSSVWLFSLSRIYNTISLQLFPYKVPPLFYSFR